MKKTFNTIGKLHPETTTKKTAWILTIILLGAISIGAFYGGSLLMLDPSGDLIHWPLRWLLHSPFVDYFVPGLVLFLVNGFLSLIIVVVVWKRLKYYDYLISLQGILLAGWIIVQIHMLQVVHPLHVILGTAGATLLVLSVIVDQGDL
jgi:hypothetical protein